MSPAADRAASSPDGARTRPVRRERRAPRRPRGPRRWPRTPHAGGRAAARRSGGRRPASARESPTSPAPAPSPTWPAGSAPVPSLPAPRRRPRSRRRRAGGGPALPLAAQLACRRAPHPGWSVGLDGLPAVGAGPGQPAACSAGRSPHPSARRATTLARTVAGHARRGGGRRPRGAAAGVRRCRTGCVAVVLGDLDTAAAVGVLVPGIGTTRRPRSRRAAGRRRRRRPADAAGAPGATSVADRGLAGLPARPRLSLAARSARDAGRGGGLLDRRSTRSGVRPARRGATGRPATDRARAQLRHPRRGRGRRPAGPARRRRRRRSWAARAWGGDGAGRRSRPRRSTRPGRCVDPVADLELVRRRPLEPWYGATPAAHRPGTPHSSYYDPRPPAPWPRWPGGRRHLSRAGEPGRRAATRAPARRGDRLRRAAGNSPGGCDVLGGGGAPTVGRSPGLPSAPWPTVALAEGGADGSGRPPTAGRSAGAGTAAAPTGAPCPATRTENASPAPPADGARPRDAGGRPRPAVGRW